jgi:hypothetical protein
MRYLDDGGNASTPATAAPITPELASALEKINANVPVISGQTTQEDLNLTPYNELTAAERAAMSTNEKTAYIKAVRDQQDANVAAERAASNPMYDFANRPDAPASNNGFINYYSWQGDTQTGSWKLYQAPDTPENQAKYAPRAIGGPTKATPGNPVGANVLVNQPESAVVGNDLGLGGNGGNGGNGLVGNGLVGNGSKALVTGTGNPIDTAAADAAKAKRVSAYNTLYDEFNKYGLGSLVSDIKNYLIDNTFDPSEFSIQLQNTQAYQDRFKANKDRIAKGLVALKPADYIRLEDQYQNIMRNYGLPDSYWTKGTNGVQPGFDQLIANDVDSTELENRLITAQQRVINADPNVLKSLKAFYPDISNGDILAYTLDPKNGLDMIKRKVTAAEIGGAQLGAGLATGAAAAEALGAAGVTGAQYAQAAPFISQAAQRGSQLADIYGETPYNQASAEAEALNTSGGAQAAAKRKKLTALETAAFSGSSGVGALGRDKAIYGAMQGQSGLY